MSHYESHRTKSSPKRAEPIRARYMVITFGAVLLFLSLSFAAFAQVTGGTISGSVTDPSAAAVPGAAVIILNQGKGESRTLTTNDNGYYSTPNLTPGRYSVTTSAPGFTSAVQSNVL